MKNKISDFLKKYWILLLVLANFTFFILPMCFQNNDNLNIVSAEHVDSGSILGSILQMNSTNLPNSFYNQNIPYHTGYYGYFYNSIAFWTFKTLKIFFRTYINNNYYIFPLTAKLLNFSFTILTIIWLYQLSRKILKHNLSRIILFSLFLIFPEYLHYVFHIKSDILGLLTSIISLNFLYDFLQNTKKIKNIILANIFGGLSVLCKQPHIFIIFPLFFGFIFSLKGNFKEKFSTFFKVYLYSGSIFLFLFFIIHPYAFIEPKAFIGRQLFMSVMTSSSISENINYWISSYLNNYLLFIYVFIPLIFVVLYTFKKFRNKNTIFLLLISIYLITYLIWLTTKVGPMRFIHYLIPIAPFSTLIFSYIFDYSLTKTTTSKLKKYLKVFFIGIILFFIFITTITIKNTLPNAKKTILSSYNFSKTENFKATKKFENEFKNQQLNKKTIIYSISLPINNTLYENSVNTWQVNEDIIKELKPELIFIDLTVYWEKPYEYWKNIAKENKLNKEIIYIENVDKEKNIILFYK